MSDEVTVSPDSLAAFRAIMEKNGRDPATSAALARYAPKDPTPGEVNRQVAPVGPDRFADGSFATQTENETVGGQAALIAYTERLQAELKDPNLPSEKRLFNERSLKNVKAGLLAQGLDLDNVPQDPRTDAQQTFDEHFSAPFDPSEYKFDGLLAGKENAAALDTELRGMLFQLGAPTNSGPALAAAVLEATGPNGYNSQRTPEAALAYSNREIELACKVCKTDRDGLFAAIKPVVAKLSEDNKAIMSRNGSFESAQVLTRLYSIARLAGARPK